MTDLETYIESLPGMTEEELVTEARSAGALLSRARKSGARRSVLNLEAMKRAIQAEKRGRMVAAKNPGESIASSYAGKVARMTDGALRTENKKLKKMLRDSAAPVRHFGTDGLSLLKQMITKTEREMRSRRLRPNPCRPLKNPVRLAYNKTDPYDVILYEYEDGDWFFEIRDPGLGGDLVYDDHDGRSRRATEREALRVIKKDLEPNPKKKVKKVASLTAFKKLPVGTVVTAQGYTGNVVQHHSGMIGFYAAPTRMYEVSEGSELGPLSSGARYFFDEDLKDLFKKGTWATAGNPKKKAKKKKGMSTAGRAAVGAGVGALALGPIGAIGLGYGAAKYKPTKAKGNPLRKIPKNASEEKIRQIVSHNIALEMEAGKPQKQAVAIAIAEARRQSERARLVYPEKNLAGSSGSRWEPYRGYRVGYVFKDNLWSYKIYRGKRRVHKAESFPFILTAAGNAKEWIDKKEGSNPPQDEKQQRRDRKKKAEESMAKRRKKRALEGVRRRKNPPSKFKVYVTGVYYSTETGEMPMRQMVVVDAITKDEARKKAASKISQKAAKMGYDFGGVHRKFKAEKIGAEQNPEKVKRKVHASFGRWVDAQKMEKKYPDTFEAPDIGQLKKKIKVGDYVKWNIGSERMWLLVADVDGDTITGLISNYPLHEKYNLDDIARIKFKHAYDYERGNKASRKRAQAFLDELAESGKSIKAKKAAKKKASKKKAKKTVKKKSVKKRTKDETIVAKSRKLWNAYVARPTKKGLRNVLDHLEEMEKVTGKKVRDEWRRAKRAAKVEAKRLKMKV